MPYFSMLRWASANLTKASLAAACGSRTPITEKTSPNARGADKEVSRANWIRQPTGAGDGADLCETERAQRKLAAASWCAPSALQDKQRVEAAAFVWRLGSDHTLQLCEQEIYPCRALLFSQAPPAS